MVLVWPFDLVGGTRMVAVVSGVRGLWIYFSDSNKSGEEVFSKGS